MPTRKFLLILVACALPFLFVGLFPSAAYLALLADLTVLVLFLLDRRGLPARDDIRLSRDHHTVLSLNRPNEVVLTIWNDGRVPLRGRGRDNVPECCEEAAVDFEMELSPNARAVHTYRIIPLQRGECRFRGVVLHARGPLGLAGRDYSFPHPPNARGKRTEEGGEVIVYPTFTSTGGHRTAALGGEQESGYHRLERRIEGTTPSQIRRWMPGDSYREINWKASARYDRPMITQYDTDRNQNLYVFVDCGRLMQAPAGRLRKLDHAVNACADLARLAVQRKDRVGLCCFSSRVKVWLDPGHKREHLLAVLRRLAFLEGDFDATNYNNAIDLFRRRAKRRSLCVLLTRLAESETSRQLMKRLRSLAPRHVPAVVSLADPEVRRTLREPARDLGAACRKLAAAELEEQAEAFAREMRRRRGYFLTLPPESLSTGAIETYLHVKAKAVL